MPAIRLGTTFHDKVWGSPESGPWFPRQSDKLGEVWFVADPQPPLLVKFIFTTERLSVQVHPGGVAGKTEMWHILRAEPGAVIGAGFVEEISADRLREASLSGEVEHLLKWWPAKPGETYFIPAGTVHAIGAGVALCEIQQYSDTTYRLYDYGRPRELHLEQGLPISHLGPHPGPQELPVRCEYFETERVSVGGSAQVDGHIAVILSGKGRIGGQPCGLGEAWLLDGPIGVEGQMDILVTRVPAA
jgi:mannose-6-phosphate isomerase